MDAGNHHAACSGCSLCLLVCPVWRRTRDPRLTPEGRAKALQHGATAVELTSSVQSCTLCGACEPVCPEQIDLVGMVLELRAELAQEDTPWRGRVDMLLDELKLQLPAAVPMQQGTVLLAGPALQARPDTLIRTQALLTCALAADDGADISSAIEAGLEIPQARLGQFLAPLAGAGTIVVADGLLLRRLRSWLRGRLPAHRVQSLGVTLSGLPALRRKLRTNDLYVIEPRAYHADYQSAVKYYNRLRAEAGCALNLDLQNIAVPAAAQGLMQRLRLTAADDDTQAQWLLKGRKPGRIVVESAKDISALERVTSTPVVHLADLAED
jgi:ferredoxin